MSLKSNFEDHRWDLVQFSTCFLKRSGFLALVNSTGSSFQARIADGKNEWRKASTLEWSILNPWPLKRSSLVVRIPAGGDISTKPLTILYIIMFFACSLRSWSDGRLSLDVITVALELGLKSPTILLAARLCTASRELIRVDWCGSQTGEAYSNTGRARLL